MFFFIILFFIALKIFDVNASSSYLIIPPCSLCAVQEQKLLKNFAVDQEYEELVKRSNQTSEEEEDDDDDESDDNKIDRWILVKNEYPQYLKINYKDTFDGYFLKLAHIKTVLQEYNYSIEVKITPKLMTLYVYSPEIKGLSRRDFKVAFAITQAMNSFNPHNNTPNKKAPKGSRLTLDETSKLMFAMIPSWSFDVWGGGHITKEFVQSSFFKGLDGVLACGLLNDLEYELQSIFLTKEKTTIILQRQVGKTVYKETIDFAKKIETIMQNILL